MEFALSRILEAFWFPPGIFLVLWIAGLLLLPRRLRWGKAVLWAGVAFSYVLCTPLGSDALIMPLEARYPPLSEQQIRQSEAGAIVVLSAGLYRDAPERGGADTVDEATLARLRYAAYLHRLTQLPIIVSGGVIYGRSRSLADAMAATLRDEFAITDVWLEGQSRTTRENATYTKLLLEERKIQRVFLVTHAAHMPRAVSIFQRNGVEVVPAPTRFFGGASLRDPLRAPLPSAQSVELTSGALHEWVGRVWYAARY